VEVGSVVCTVHATTGRADYKGRCMNRAARLLDKAAPGTVRCDPI
jgi:hypothetical protein